MGQSVYGVGSKGSVSIDNFDTIIKPIKNSFTLDYHHTLLFVNNILIYFYSLGTDASLCDAPLLFP